MLSRLNAEHYLLSSLEIDEESNRHARLSRERYGDEQKPYELEALPPAELIRLVRETIASVLDMRAYNQEVRQEQEDAQEIEDGKNQVMDWLKTFKFPD